MTTFEISYQRNGVYQAILINAETAEIAIAYFQEYKPDAQVIGYGEHHGRKKPGMPERTIPEGWAPEAQEADQTAQKLEALKAHLIENENFTGEEAEELTYNERFECFTCGSWEYKVFTEEEADKATRESILESLWAFRAEFILHHTAFYSESTDREDEAFCRALEELQQSICEGATPIIKALIEDLDKFVEDAIFADGRGHFLSTYDGDELDVGDFFAYRIN